MINPATCRHQDKWLEDPDHPLKQRVGGNGFVLVTIGQDSHRREVPVVFCLFCGARLDGAKVEGNPQEIACLCIRSRAEDPSGPVHWDASVEEYNFTTTEEGGRSSFFRIYFCPWCGIRLPQGRRSELLARPSEADVQVLRSRLEGATTVAEVISRIGEPDRLWPGYSPTPAQVRLYGMKPTLRQLDFLRVSPSVEVTIKEFEDGSIRILYSGLPLRI